MSDQVENQNVGFLMTRLKFDLRVSHLKEAFSAALHITCVIIAQKVEKLIFTPNSYIHLKEHNKIVDQERCTFDDD